MACSDYQCCKISFFTGDAMIEVSHPNDIGCVAYAQAYKKMLGKVFRK